LQAAATAQYHLRRRSGKGMVYDSYLFLWSQDLSSDEQYSKAL